MRQIVTTALLNEMAAAFADGEPTPSVAKRLGLGRTLVNQYRKAMGFDSASQGRPTKMYRFIEADTGEVAAYGTLEECAAELDTTPGYIKQMLTRARKRPLRRFIIESE